MLIIFRRCCTADSGSHKSYRIWAKCYFFTFTDDFARYTETCTGLKKGDWFRCLEAFHNLCKTQSKEGHPVKRLRLYYGSELQSKVVDEWLTKKVLHSNLLHLILKNKTASLNELEGLLCMTRAKILEGNLNDELWIEIILAMNYVKNVRLTSALQGKNPYQAQQEKSPDMSHLQILGSTVYVFIHDEKRVLKSEKWAPAKKRCHSSASTMA